MNLKKQNIGSFESYILLSIRRLADDAYGTLIIEDVEQLTGREVSLGAVYTVLKRLENKRLVESRMGEPTGQRGGRAKRYFRLTTAGEICFQEHLRSLRRDAESFALAEVRS
ncbi:MAG: PadR family transcriptional regulator [Janthinobacterium lividum]